METRDRVTEWRSEYKRLLKNYPIAPKRVYLASSYRSARGEYGVREYVQEAADLARKLWKIGLAPLSPVLNTAHFGGDDIPVLAWLLGDFAWVRASDALVVHPNACDEEGKVTSRGVAAEIEVARDAELPVFYLMDHWAKLCAWAKSGVVKNSEVGSHDDLQRCVAAGCEMWDVREEAVR